MPDIATFASDSDGSAAPWRALIVDPHPVCRLGLKELLQQAHIEVCGEVEGAREALDCVRQLKPQLVTLEISLATGAGLELLQKIKASEPTVRVLVVSVFDEEIFASRAFELGAAGYVCKSAPVAEIAEAVRAIRHGHQYSKRAAAEKTTHNRHHASNGAPVEQKLSDRELQILAFIGEGLQTQQIAERLSLSHSTIETYRERIKVKLTLPSGTALARYAFLWWLQKTSGDGYAVEPITKPA